MTRVQERTYIQQARELFKKDILLYTITNDFVNFGFHVITFQNHRGYGHQEVEITDCRAIDCTKVTINVIYSHQGGIQVYSVMVTQLLLLYSGFLLSYNDKFYEQ